MAAEYGYYKFFSRQTTVTLATGWVACCQPVACAINPLVPSVPKNGTPTLTVNREIIQALMGYTTVSTYSTFNTSPNTINLLRIGGEYLTKSLAKQTKCSICIS